MTKKTSFKNFTFVDLFSGIGGFHISLSKHGGSCLAFSEIDNDAINSYCNNAAKIKFKERRNWDDVINREADINKISSLLGYKSEIKITDGLKKTCDWLISLKS